MDVLLVIVALCLCAVALFVIGVAAVVAIPVFILAVIAIAVFEFIGTNFVRRRFGKLQFPVVKLRNVNTGRHAHLVGVIHIAEPGYWERIERFIADIKPHAVLFEMVTSPTPEEVCQFTLAEHRVWENSYQRKGLIQLITKLLGLKYQKEGLSYPSSWIRTDMLGKDMIKSLAANDERHPVESNQYYESAKRNFDEDIPVLKWFLHKMIGHMPLMSLISRHIERGPYRKGNQLVIIEMRNVIGVEGIVEHNNHGDVVSIWGAGHLSGMVHMLELLDYEVVSREWHTAWKPESISFLSIFRNVELSVG